MESNAGVDMEDYWNEVLTYHRPSTHSEEEARSHEDEGESAEHFLEGLGIPVKPDSELSEDNITISKFMGTLNPRQEEALKRRVRTLNATVRRKKQRQKPDIRNFFTNTDNSSTGTRSRSATPDSLDSVSPPRTPPDPHPKAWLEDPYRSSGSLDSGNHSLVTSPPSVITPHTTTTSTALPPPPPSSSSSFTHNHHHHHHTVLGNNNNNNSSTHNNNNNKSRLHPHHSTRTSVGGQGVVVVGGRRLTPPSDTRREWLDDPSPLHHHHHQYPTNMTRAPSLDTLPTTTTTSTTTTSTTTNTAVGGGGRGSGGGGGGGGKGKEVRRQRSYARDLARDVRNFHHSSKQGVYEFYPKDSHQHQHHQHHQHHTHDDHEVQVLNYRYIGSVYIPHARCKEKEKRPSLDSQTSSLSHISTDLDAIDTDGRRSSGELHHRRSHTVTRNNTREHHHNREHLKENNREHQHHHHHTTREHLKENREHLKENRPRSGSSTDFGFKVVPQKSDDEFPELVLEMGRSGQTRMDWLDEGDLNKLTSLALLELDILFTEHAIHHRWRKLKKRKHSKEDHGVFGVPLETLLERDRHHIPHIPIEANAPLILHKLVCELDHHGLTQEGILRVPGHRSQTEQLRRTLDTHFYSAPSTVDAALRSATPNDLAALVKTFLRELPQPLLTHAYMPAFYKTHRIQGIGERVQALSMLVLLLPIPHRDTLHALLQLCARVVALQSQNKMSLYNVAMIVAPNLFLPTTTTGHHRSRLNLRTDDKEQQLNHEMTYASVTTQLTQMLVKYRDVLWTVPQRLVAQVRRQYQAEALKQHNSTPMRRLLSRKSKESIQRPIENEVDFQEGILRVSAPQFNKTNLPVKLNSRMTAADLLSRLIEEVTQLPENPRRVEGRREMQYKRGGGGGGVVGGVGFLPPTHLPPSTPSSVSSTTTTTTTSSLSSPPFLPCLLTGSLKTALLQHALHERGGNIGDRRLDPNAKLLAIYQDNPNAEDRPRQHQEKEEKINGGVGQRKDKQDGGVGQRKDKQDGGVGQRKDKQDGGVGQKEDKEDGGVGQEEDKQDGGVGQEEDKQDGGVGQEEDKQDGRVGQKEDKEDGGVGQKEDKEDGGVGQEEDKQDGGVGQREGQSARPPLDSLPLATRDRHIDK
ncbi:hypothetical protein Pcinc_034985 [Petrolisthes cinctipes]|uniref:Rho-GAP domain-containing protein n=1 Tax=Petrolisthes cinctipes TaxID=88211 RepID=A0AAE1EP46_PETCI|nr:hypothetical protein Pcinc_034985 [Petrolisthes cinctipes]